MQQVFQTEKLYEVFSSLLVAKGQLATNRLAMACLL
jgi:hypothetical protein